MTGTPFYMSPEQVQCLPVDQRSDIYSLGLVVYEMVTGRRPFDGDDQWQVMEMRANHEIPDPAHLVPDMPKTLRDFIRKACARDPADRYQNISEVLEFLNPLIGEFALAGGETFRTQRKIKMFYLVYSDEHNKELKAAVDEFNAKIQRLGIELKAGGLIDV